MDDYLTRVAEAVRAACFEACNENGGDMGAICSIDLPAIIASVPRPEPVAWLFRHPVAGYLTVTDSGNATDDGVFPVYAEPVAVPDGWKMVPVEPSIAACIIGSNAAGGAIDGRQCAVVYRAMLAAAPEAPQVAVQDRRAEACLTAMNHISTETLESLNRAGIKFDATRGYAEELEAEIATLREQNAALVAAVELVLSHVDRNIAAINSLVVDQLRAALASAKGDKA